jgi:hypothetical protein
MSDAAAELDTTAEAIMAHYGYECPATPSSETRSSRNARRHGLAAFNIKDPAMSGEIKQLVDAICHGDNDTLLREHAVAIAESQLWLSCIGWEKLAALERLREKKTR